MKLFDSLEKLGVEGFSEKHKTPSGLVISLAIIGLWKCLGPLLEVDMPRRLVDLALSCSGCSRRNHSDAEQIRLIHELLKIELKPKVPETKTLSFPIGRVLTDAHESAFLAMKKVRDAFGLWLDGEVEDEKTAWRTASAHAYNAAVSLADFKTDPLSRDQQQLVALMFNWSTVRAKRKFRACV